MGTIARCANHKRKHNARKQCRSGRNTLWERIAVGLYEIGEGLPPLKCNLLRPSYADELITLCNFSGASCNLFVLFCLKVNLKNLNRGRIGNFIAGG